MVSTSLNDAYEISLPTGLRRSSSLILQHKRAADADVDPTTGYVNFTIGAHEARLAFSTSGSGKFKLTCKEYNLEKEGTAEFRLADLVNPMVALKHGKSPNRERLKDAQRKAQLLMLQILPMCLQHDHVWFGVHGTEGRGVVSGRCQELMKVVLAPTPLHMNIDESQWRLGFDHLIHVLRDKSASPTWNPRPFADPLAFMRSRPWRQPFNVIKQWKVRQTESVVQSSLQTESATHAFLYKTMEHITSLPLFRDGSIVASPSTEEEEDWLRLYGYLVCKYLVDGYRIDSISSHMCIILSIPEYKWKEHIRTHEEHISTHSLPTPELLGLTNQSTVSDVQQRYRMVIPPQHVTFAQMDAHGLLAMCKENTLDLTMDSNIPPDWLAIYSLFDGKLDAYERVRDGFFGNTAVSGTLCMLNWMAMENMLGRDTSIDADFLLGCIQCDEDGLKAALRTIVEKRDEAWMRRFVLLGTGLAFEHKRTRVKLMPTEQLGNIEIQVSTCMHTIRYNKRLPYPRIAQAIDEEVRKDPSLFTTG